MKDAMIPSLKDAMIPSLIFLTIVLTIIFALFTFVARPVMNIEELKYCKYYSQYRDTIYEPHFFLDKCYILEDGEELTVTQYQAKHKYDGINIRR